jgi:plastocyanin
MSHKANLGFLAAITVVVVAGAGQAATPTEALHFELNWDVATDLDLHVKEPAGNLVDNLHPTSATGGQYTGDVINGTGPEVVTWTVLTGGTFEYWATNAAGAATVNYSLTVYQSGNLVATQTGTLPAVAQQESQHYQITVTVAITVSRLTASGSTALVGDTVSFSAETSNPGNVPSTSLSFFWNFGDGTAGTGAQPQHIFAAEGQYTVVVQVSDGSQTSAPAPMTITAYAPNASAEGVKNVTDGSLPIINPVSQMWIAVDKSDGGVVVLKIDVTNLRAAFDVSTDVDGIQSRRATVTGFSPAVKFTDSSVFVATAHALDAGTTNARGKVRRTLAVSNRETGAPDSFTAPPSSNAIKFRSIKAKFGFTPARIAKGDVVTLSAEIELPVGLNVKDVNGLNLALGVGNIIDHVVVDGRGNGKASSDAKIIKKVHVKLPRVDKQTGLTAGAVKDRTARIDVTLNTLNMVANGFDTEGVDPKNTATNLKIQVAFVLAGVSYEDIVPATLKVSRQQDTAGLTMSRRAP